MRYTLFGRTARCFVKENYKKGKFKKYIANLLFFNKFLKGAKSVIYLNQGEYSNSLVKSINPRSVIIPNGCYLPPEVKAVRSNIA